MDMAGKVANAPYYSELIVELTGISEEMSKQVGELENRLGAVLSTNSAPTSSTEILKKTRGSGCALDERLESLVGQFSVRRNDLAIILRRIQL
jgi:hypothetical protein